ncbi:MAG: triose-phosphate isomerase [Gallionellales bacterium RBG_16_56_9]|nr:MAG: triose-phosphate isomerase [Gallionellales bacterium RBG_16_56_9]
MARKLIVGNWKMNGTLATNAALLDGISAGGVHDCDLAVCVPAPYFAQCRDALSGGAVAWGGQDVSMHEAGAYTGEIAAAMLRDFACTYVIVGHSERRALHAETDQVVAKKTVRALAGGLLPIVCVGETLEQRESGQTEAVVERQIDAVLALLEVGEVQNIVIAYEPVWAIGTGKTATPAMAQEVHAILRARLLAKNPAARQVRILYGGSMKPDNAAQLLAMPDIDGGLIGGAALKAADFLAIAQAATALASDK